MKKGKGVFFLTDLLHIILVGTNLICNQSVNLATESAAGCEMCQCYELLTANDTLPGMWFMCFMIKMYQVEMLITFSVNVPICQKLDQQSVQ